eukprot:Lithocolla_globosa_v1_NODE_4518_length_1418_cov_1.548789.p2 type:complete len:136 gc:universal NODE_4518_length_1418_cov_1.548789:752-345(-)
MVIAVINISTNESIISAAGGRSPRWEMKYFATKTTSISTAAASPHSPICSASPPSLIWSGVSWEGVRSSIMTRPPTECTPTPITTIRPAPSSTLVPPSMKGSFCSDLTIASDSPVSADSSVRRACDCNNTPSHGT